MLPANEALSRLQLGNQRSVESSLSADFAPSAAERTKMAEGQSPIAAILSCSDSRVPPELLFDQGYGDLFVIRTAGNYAGSSQIGSIEFAVEALGVNLIVVLGHESCGAVKAARQPPAPGALPPMLSGIVQNIAEDIEGTTNADLDTSINRNAQASAQRILTSSENLSSHLLSGRIKVASAYYSIQSGTVRFIEDTP